MSPWERTRRAEGALMPSAHLSLHMWQEPAPSPLDHCNVHPSHARMSIRSKGQLLGWFLGHLLPYLQASAPPVSPGVNEVVSCHDKFLQLSLLRPDQSSQTKYLH